MISEALGLFIKTLTADDKHPLRNSENLRQLIPMQFSKKQKNFPNFFAQFPICISSFEHFGK